MQQATLPFSPSSSFLPSHHQGIHIILSTLPPASTSWSDPFTLPYSLRSLFDLSDHLLVFQISTQSTRARLHFHFAGMVSVSRGLLPLFVFLFGLITLIHASLTPTRRDAFTSVRGTRGDRHMKTLPRAPPGAYPLSLPVTPSSSVFTWYSKTPHNESSAESAFIIIHGVDRNANTYFSILNNAWAAARDAKSGSAKANSIRVAPQFFSTNEDKGAYNESQLAWGDSNAWTAGEGSTNPPGSGVSSWAVLDMLLNRFADQGAYPNMTTITFVAHGGGAQMLQRYAVMGMPNPDPARLSVRYVIGDPSSELYFTQDRPVGVDSSCPLWNQYRYGVNNYSAPYGTLNSLVAPALFRTYAAKEVRYVVGLDDTLTDKGDQTCMAHAVGGPHRRNRSLAYWKYIHLLSGANPDSVKQFPGTFPSLDAKYGRTNQTNIPRSNRATVASFRGVKLGHTLTVVQGVGHSAGKIYGSQAGRNALFAAQGSSGSGGVGNAYAGQLKGYTATASGATNYQAGEDDDDS